MSNSKLLCDVGKGIVGWTCFNEFLCAVGKPVFSRKYMMSWYQLTHSFVYSYYAWKILRTIDQNDPALDKQYYKTMVMSLSYFIYDTFGKPFGTLYTVP